MLHNRCAVGIVAPMLLVAGLVWLPAELTAAEAFSSSVTLQAGAFAQSAAAEHLEDKLRGAGFADVRLVAPPSGGEGLTRVLVGEFPGRQEASIVQKQLEDKGFRSFVRSAAEVSSGSEPLNLDPTARYFSEPTKRQYASVDAVAIEKGMEAAIKEVDRTPAARTESIDGARQLLSQLSDDHPVKGHLMFTIARKSIVAKHNTNDAMRMLETVANGKVATTHADQVDARKLVARILHYHLINKSSALKAYQQILRDAERQGDSITAAQMRMEITAVLFEALRSGNSSRVDVSTKAEEFYARTQSDLAPVEDAERASAIRRPLSRIGLMRIEIAVGMHDYDRANALGLKYVDDFAPYPECGGEVAAVYLILADAAYYQQDGETARMYADMAIVLGELQERPLWQDANRDTLWQAYLRKLAAIVEQQAGTREEADQLVHDIKSRFSQHPCLKRYFPE